MINREHYASTTIKERLDELHRLWDLLLRRLQEKGLKLQQALQLIQFIRECDEVMFWINDKVLPCLNLSENCLLLTGKVLLNFTNED